MREILEYLFETTSDPSRGVCDLLDLLARVINIKILAHTWREEVVGVLCKMESHTSGGESHTTNPLQLIWHKS